MLVMTMSLDISRVPFFRNPKNDADRHRSWTECSGGFFWSLLHGWEDLYMSHADLNLRADVLVIGGGPAGTWAALTAAKGGAKSCACR
ncbi:hypothetical protein GCM10020331_059380 [Ectobacillus funiculus]